MKARSHIALDAPTSRTVVRVCCRERKWFNGAVIFYSQISSASISRARRFPLSGLGGNIPVKVAEELLHGHLLRRVFVHVADAAPGVDRGGDRGRGIVVISRT